MKREIEELRNGIRQINQNSIPNLVEQLHRKNEKVIQTIKNETRSHFNNFEEEKRHINQKLRILEENQRTKVSLDELARFPRNFKIQQGINQNEKEMIQNEFLQLKQNVTNIKNKVLCLNNNKNLYGTSWRIIDDLHINGMLKTFCLIF